MGEGLVGVTAGSRGQTSRAHEGKRKESWQSTCILLECPVKIAVVVVVQELHFQEFMGFNVFYACAQENHRAGGSCEARA